MRSLLSIVFVGVGGLAIVACSGSGSDGPRGGGGTGGVMLDCSTLTNPPADCDKSCLSDGECTASYCENNTKCVAHCAATEGCGENATCNARGRCVPNMGTGGTGNTGGGNSCQSVQITPTRSIPNVMFLVDQSGSMPWCLYADNCNPQPGELSRWEAAHTAITSIVSELDSIVRFGLTTYQSANGGSTPDVCPIFDTQVDFAMDNFGSINMSYDAQFPGGEDTPTGDSIDVLVDSIQQNPPPDEGPTIIVLATDGAPDSCENPDPNPTTQAQNEAVNAAARASGLGIDVFVLWVGVLADMGIESHLQDVANAGVGNGPTDPDALFWIGENADGLETAFRDIISDSISCDIQMDRRFDDLVKACAEGDVRLNGNPLDCPSEWRVKPGVDDVIELVDDPMVDNDACDTLKSGDVTFSAVFPCGAIVVE
jgi:hypothetical protein